MKDVLDLSFELETWVEGIVEDKPIPVEIKHIAFAIVKDINFYHLEFYGCEQKEGLVSSPDYYPLDAQFFIFKYPESTSYFIQLLQECLDILLSKNYFASLFYRKNIAIVLFNEKIVKLIKRGMA